MRILETGLSIGPLLGGIDDNDYVDRWTAAGSATRIFRNVDRAILTVEGAAVEDRAQQLAVVELVRDELFRQAVEQRGVRRGI